MSSPRSLAWTRARRVGLALVVAAMMLCVPSALRSSEPPASGWSVAPGQSATMLPDGRWLIAGGLGPTGPVATAALWHPGTGELQLLTPGLGVARAGHTATLLPTGAVLVFGGIGA